MAVKLFINRVQQEAAAASSLPADAKSVSRAAQQPQAKESKIPPERKHLILHFHRVKKSIGL